MARPKSQYRNKAEKEAALEATRQQWKRIQTENGDGSYYLSQNRAYERRNGGGDIHSIQRAARFASDKTNQRYNQLTEAWQNRLRAIEQAGVAG